ncbi:MAG: thioredoxin domain-containing protein [Myxococcota bacterium]
MSKKTTPPAPSFPPVAVALLLSASVAEALLALYQWMELLAVRAGATPLCAFSETLNCATVWSSDFAARVHALTGMPVAALGLVWGLTAFGVTAVLVHRALKEGELSAPIAAVKLVAAAGVLSCVSFAVASFRTGAVCVACLATYALVAAFALAAFRLLPGPALPSGGALKSALALAVAVLLPVYLALLYPGLKTPTGRGSALPAPPPSANNAGGAPASESDKKLAEFLQSLPWAEQQAVSDFMAHYKASAPRDTSRFVPRQRLGPASAPMQLVEFTDIRCGHCRALVELLSQLRRAVPEGKMSIEPRYLPLDSECNKAMPHSDGSGISCLGAKAQICLEGAPDFWELRDKLFAAQPDLSKDRILSIASSGSVSREKLTACIESPETQKKLEEDISYAMLYQPQGTPLVLVNGREGGPVASWLYAMAMTGANPESPAFSKLPPPRPMRGQAHDHDHGEHAADDHPH